MQFTNEQQKQIKHAEFVDYLLAPHHYSAPTTKYEIALYSPILIFIPLSKMQLSLPAEAVVKFFGCACSPASSPCYR